MADSLEIRRFRPDDRERVNGFFDSLGFDARMFFNRLDGNRQNALRYFDGTLENTIQWMACDGDIMAGYVFLWDVDSSVVWFGIAVADAYQRRGLGWRLAQTAISWAKKHGKGGVLLTTHAANFKAQALYEKCGFRRIGTAFDGEWLYLLRFS